MFGNLHLYWGRVPSLATRSLFALSVFFLSFGGQSVVAEVSTTVLRQQTRDLLRHEAVTEDEQAKDAATAALCDLYVVLRSDDRYATSEMLKGDAAKVRRRLISIAERRQRQLKRDEVPKPSDLAAEIDSVIAAALSQNGPELSDAVGGQGGGALGDNGWQLVELIQRVVAPDFWEPVGGPGAIRYFAMRRVLVVRATSDVHEQVRDLLMALR